MLDLWNELQNFLTTSTNLAGISDAISLFNILVKEEAWTFSLVMEILPPPTYWNPNTTTRSNKAIVPGNV
jgi:hypothetical protein